MVTPTEKTKVLKQLTDIFLALEKHPFPSTGSLYPSYGSSKVCGFAQPQLFGDPNTPLGPPETLESSLSAILVHQKGLITKGELSSLPVDNHLSFRWREDKIAEVLSVNNEADFFLKHNDDKCDHIVVDEEFTMTGIID